MTVYLTAEQILFLHDRLIRETGGSHGVRDLSLLLSAVSRPQSTFEGRNLYPDIYNQAAALMESLVRNHPFVDGNKRTGVVAAGLFLRINGFRLVSQQEELVAIAVRVATGRIQLDELAGRLRSNSSAE